MNDDNNYMFRPIAASPGFLPKVWYYHTFWWKPDDGCNRPKHVVIIILLNIFLDIVVLLTDTYTYCLYTHNGDGSF